MENIQYELKALWLSCGQKNTGGRQKNEGTNQANVSSLKEQNELSSYHHRVLNELVESRSGLNSTMWLNRQQCAMTTIPPYCRQNPGQREKPGSFTGGAS